MSGLDLAIEYLKKRAIPTEKNDDLRHLISVNDANEVQEVLDMVKNGTFTVFYSQIKSESPRFYP